MTVDSAGGAFEGTIPVPGGTLWAQWAGEGSGVVLIHAGIADARMWDPQWGTLVSQHRTARYDTRGYNRTTTEAVPFSNRADVIAVMDAAGLERAVIVGCSRGGAIALDTALEYPDRVSGLVWVCGGVSGAEVDDLPEATALFERQEALYEAKDWEAMADLDVADLGRRDRPARGSRRRVGPGAREADVPRQLHEGARGGRADRARPAGVGTARRAADPGARDRRAARPAGDRRRWRRCSWTGRRTRGASTSRTSPTCRASSARPGSPRRCARSSTRWTRRASSRRRPASARWPASSVPQATTRSIANRTIGRASIAWLAYCGYFSRSAATAAACSSTSRGSGSSTSPVP